MVYKSFIIPIYSGRLHVIFSNDCEKELEQINKKFEVDVDNFDFAGYSSRIDNHYLLLLNLKYINSDTMLIGTIAHEALHISNFILKQTGIKPDVDNDEAQAYLLTWIVEQVYKFKMK